MTYGDDDERPEVPWYQTSAAVTAAGFLGVLVIIAIFIAVVQTANHSTRPDTPFPTLSTTTTTTPTTTTTTKTRTTTTKTRTTETTTTTTETTTEETTTTETPKTTTTRTSGLRATPAPHPMFPNG